MDKVPLRAGAFVFGGLFIGIWLFLALFPTTLFEEARMNYGLWVFWGLVGLVIAGGIYAGRMAKPTVRMAVWIVLGIAVGMLLTAAIVQTMAEATAALFTFGGGLFIITALPGMQVQALEGTAGETPYASPETHDEPPTRGRRLD